MNTGSLTKTGAENRNTLELDPQVISTSSSYLNLKPVKHRQRAEVLYQESVYQVLDVKVYLSMMTVIVCRLQKQAANCEGYHPFNASVANENSVNQLKGSGQYEQLYGVKVCQLGALDSSKISTSCIVFTLLGRKQQT